MNKEIDISNVILKTKRLTLRSWKQEDLDDFFEYAAVDGVGQPAGWTPHKSKEESQIILNDFIERKETFALVHNNRVIGSLGVEKYDEERFSEFSELNCRELGFVLSKSYWGKGLMPEAVKEVIKYLFAEKDLDIILCGHFVNNVRSARVQEKCGFKPYKEGKVKTQTGTIEDEIMNVLKKENWLENKL